MQEAQVAGCRTSAEADRYLEHKRKREAEESACRAKENAQVGPSNQGIPNVFMASESIGKDSNSRPAGHATLSSVNDMDIMGLNGADLLSEAVSCQYFLSSYLVILILTPILQWQGHIHLGYIFCNT